MTKIPGIPFTKIVDEHMVTLTKLNGGKEIDLRNIDFSEIKKNNNGKNNDLPVKEQLRVIRGIFISKVPKISEFFGICVTTKSNCLK